MTLYGRPEVYLGNDGPLWIMLHGYTDRNRFRNDTRMHEFANTAYVKAPSKIRGWTTGDTDDVVEMVLALHSQLDIVFALHSKANGPGHRYAQACIDAGLPVVCIVHYAGFWRRFKASCPCVPVCNTQDKRGMKRGTEAAANAYGTSVLWVDGGPFKHRWNAENNPEIINRVNSQAA